MVVDEINQQSSTTSILFTTDGIIAVLSIAVDSSSPLQGGASVEQRRLLLSQASSTLATTLRLGSHRNCER